GQPYQLGPAVRLHVRGVDDGQPPGGKPLARHELQRGERVSGGGLVVLVVGHQASERVGGQHLSRPEMLPREGGLAGAGDADKHHERKLGYLDHGAPALVNTAIWVGVPTSGSSSPTPRAAAV